jgi:predicted O-methyltransferase YrrM
MPSRRKSQKHSAQKRAQQRQTVRDLGAMVAKEFRNLSAQWHAAMSLHTYLTTGKRMGALQGWPISPDLGLLLVDLVESGHYQAIIEFGSGTSTMLMATANRNGASGPSSPCRRWPLST